MTRRKAIKMAITYAMFPFCDDHCSDCPLCSYYPDCTNSVYEAFLSKFPKAVCLDSGVMGIVVYLVYYTFMTILLSVCVIAPIIIVKATGHKWWYALYIIAIGVFTGWARWLDDNRIKSPPEYFINKYLKED